LYLKLYGGFASTEHALVTELAPLLDEYQTEGVIERWFFIRYADPRRHIRLRVQGDPQILHRRIEPDLLSRVERLRECGSLWKVEVATYDREAQRYGGAAGIGLVEQIFGVDSRACGRVLRLVGGDHEARWGVTLLGMNDILCATGLEDERRAQLVARLAEGRLMSIDPRSVSAKPIARRYRELRARVEHWLGPDGPPAIAAIMGERARALVPLAAELSDLDDRAELTRPLDLIVGDLLHMHANRMLRADANAQECVLYEFLRRTYRSTAARDRADTTATATTPGR
jgi:thiopeptide-type bacteriocin biosynthesis protein